MANAFDQFDAPAGRGNVFDQFDAPPQQPQQTKQPQDKVGGITGLARSVAEGVPIVGAAPRYLNALTQAVAEPLLTGDETISHAPTLRQRISEDLQRENARSESFEAEHPIASTAAGLAGGVGAGGALLKTAPTLGARLLGLTAKTPVGAIAQGAASGAGISGADALLRGNDPVKAAATGALLGGAAYPTGRALGAVAGKIGDLITAPARRAAEEGAAAEVLGSRGVPVVPGSSQSVVPLTEGGTLSTQSLHDLKNSLYGDIDLKASIHPDYVREKVGNITNDLLDANFKPIDHKEVFDRLQHLKQEEPVPSQAPVPGLGQLELPPAQGPTMAVPQSPAMQPAPTKFGDVMAAITRMGDIAKENVGTSTAEAARRAQNGLEGLLEDIGQNNVVSGSPTESLRTLQEARATTASMKRAQLYEEAIDRAQRQASSAGTGGNIDNALRQQFKSLRNSKQAMFGATAEEKDAIDQIISGTFTQNLLRQIGRLSPVGNTLSMYGELMSGLMGGSPEAIGAAIAGHISKRLSDAMTLGRAQRLSAMVRGRAPASVEMRRRIPVRSSPIAGRLSAFNRATQLGRYNTAGQQQE